MKVRRFPKTQMFRAIVGDACFYVRADRIRAGTGDLQRCNAALQKALDALEFTRSDGSANHCPTVGIAGTWEGLNVQLNVACP